MYKAFIAAIAATTIVATSIFAGPAQADSDRRHSDTRGAIMHAQQSQHGFQWGQQGGRDGYGPRYGNGQGQNYGYGHQGQGWGNAPQRGGHVTPRGQGWSHGPQPVPASCLRTHDTRFGQVQMFSRRCLELGYSQFENLPFRCAVSSYTDKGLRRGYDPLCLRTAGYEADRRR